MTLPNKITVGRLVMAGIFFLTLVWVDHPGLAGLAFPGRRVLLNVAFVLFVVAALSDILDGWVARRWQLTSDFGRVADPFTDKVMTCGSFIFLTTMPLAPGGQAVFVPAWVAVLIVAREFLVTGLRGFIEAKGGVFGAGVTGKAKMLVQCWTIGCALCVLANLAHAAWARTLTAASVWASLAITLFSGAAYVVAARKTLREKT